MKFQNVTLHNWRSIKDENIKFQDMMIFIGQNNHGKSNILYALLFFFGQISIEALDFNGDSNELFIEVVFSDLDVDDQTTFKKYLTSENTIKVRKQAIKGEGTEYHGYLEIPNEEWLKEDKISDYATREIATTLPLASHLPESGRISKDQFKEAQDKYIVEHKDALTFSYQIENGPFLGTGVGSASRNISLSTLIFTYSTRMKDNHPLRMNILHVIFVLSLHSYCLNILLLFRL